MAADPKELKLIHLFITLMILAIGGALGWGQIQRQQTINTSNIDKKVSKEVFEMHMAQQKEQYEGIQNSLDNINTKLDK